jgi:hypothetical protein
LESITGGRCDALNVSIIRDRVFSFTVANKKVGFLLTNRRKFTGPKFICYFYLWNYGGPQWRYEFNLWQKRSNEEWTLVCPYKKRAQLGFNAMLSKPKKSSFKSASSQRKMVRFATIVNYDICKSYGLRMHPHLREELVAAGYDLLPEECPPPSPVPKVHRTSTVPHIQFGTVQIARDSISNVSKESNLAPPPPRLTALDKGKFVSTDSVGVPLAEQACYVDVPSTSGDMHACSSAGPTGQVAARPLQATHTIAHADTTGATVPSTGDATTQGLESPTVQSTEARPLSSQESADAFDAMVDDMVA